MYEENGHYVTLVGIFILILSGNGSLFDYQFSKKLGCWQFIADAAM